MIVAGSIGALMTLGWYQSMFGISLAVGETILAGAYQRQKEPSKVQMWGFLVLIASIVALFCIGGFGIGSILGIIGGRSGYLAGKHKA